MPRRRKPKRYRIRTVTDLFAIPPEKIGHCLRDIRAVIATHRALSEACLAAQFEPPDEIVWIDDGKHDIYAVVSSSASRQTSGTNLAE